VILTFTDTETTGLPDKEPFLSRPELGPEVVEYAIADWEDGETSNVEHVLIKPRNLLEVATEDDDGTWRTLDGYPLRYRGDEWKAAGAACWNLTDSQRVLRRLANRQTLAGSNPGFDRDRFAFELARFPVKGANPYWNHRMVGTEHLAVFLLHAGLVESRGLVALAQFFGVEHDAHTALGDVRASIAVFEHMVDLYHYRPRMMREALEEIASCSPDEGMAEFAAKAARGEVDE
jgi:DNA polymerase III epsilon subunit-like protein